MLQAGAQAFVPAAGMTAFSIVGSSAVEIVSSAAVSAGTVTSGGNITVGSSAVVAGGLTISGGTAVIAGFAAAGQAVRFVGTGGDLVLGNIGAFAAAISGFVPGDKIDLGGFIFAGAEKATFTEPAALTSGTLTIVDGTQQAHLTVLGNFTTSAFTLANDGTGGTFITHS